MNTSTVNCAMQLSKSHENIVVLVQFYVTKKLFFLLKKIVFLCLNLFTFTQVFSRASP